MRPDADANGMSAVGLIEIAISRDLSYSEDQEALTEEHVIPAMPEIVELATAARRKVDAGHLGLPARGYGIAPSSGEAASKYPVGFCDTICDEVFRGLSDTDLVRGLKGRGVVFKIVYVVLYGRYFQNAIQIGNLYLDAANDTVDPKKPFLEWMHIRDLDYRNLESWEQVASVAESYFGCTAVPNREFPLLAPFIPFFAIRKDGRMELIVFQDSFFLKDLGGGLVRYVEWINCPSGIPARSLPDEDRDLLGKAFGSNEFGNFPFEYALSTVSQLEAQAREIHAASDGEGGGEIIRKLIELARLAARDFNARGLVSAWHRREG